MTGFNNIELISDRSIEINLQEMAGKAALPAPRGHRFADGGEQTRNLARHCSARKRRRSRRPGAQLRLPARMSERGMGSAVGQVPEYCQQITGSVKEGAHAGDRRTHG